MVQRDRLDRSETFIMGNRLLADCHVHSNHSRDAEHSVTDLCKQAVSMGIFSLTITDHCECNEYRTDGYDRTIRESIGEVKRLQNKVKDKLTLLCGMELGQPLQDLSAADDALSIEGLDFVLASVHNIKNREDYYFMKYQKDTVVSVLEEYFDEIIRVIDWGKFDSLAHLTYPLRYILKNSGIKVNLHQFSEQIDIILKRLIKKEKALEINTSGLRQGLGSVLPALEIVSRFKELGGKYITIGSDAHKTSDLAAGILEGFEIAHQAGFSHFTIYCNRKPMLFPFFKPENV